MVGGGCPRRRGGGSCAASGSFPLGVAAVAARVSRAWSRAERRWRGALGPRDRARTGRGSGPSAAQLLRRRRRSRRPLCAALRPPAPRPRAAAATADVTPDSGLAIGSTATPLPGSGHASHCAPPRHACGRYRGGGQPGTPAPNPLAGTAAPPR